MTYPPLAGAGRAPVAPGSGATGRLTTVGRTKCRTIDSDEHDLAHLGTAHASRRRVLRQHGCEQAAQGRRHRGSGRRNKGERISERQREVALAIGRGLSHARIAAEAYMSVATVKAHVSRLLTRLEVANRQPLTRHRSVRFDPGDGG